MKAHPHGIRPNQHLTRLRTLALGSAAALAMLDAHAAPVTVSASFDRYVGNVQFGADPRSPVLDYRTRINGVDVRPERAIAGQEALFLAADPADPGSAPSGVGYADTALDGTSSVRFGFATSNNGGAFDDEMRNLIEFTPGPVADVVKGQEFLLGTFTFENGNWFIDDRLHRFSVTLTTHSLDAQLDGHVFSDTLELFITANCFDATCAASGSTPATNADQFSFAGHPELGSVSVYEFLDSPVPERNRGSVNLFGRIGSLDPTRLADPAGGLILGAFTPQPPVVGVSSPAQGLMLTVGLVAMLMARRSSGRR